MQPYNGNPKQIGLLLLAAIILPIVTFFIAAPRYSVGFNDLLWQLSSRPSSEDTRPTRPICRLASGYLYTGVKLYMNNRCEQPFATVLGGNNRHQFFDGRVGRGLKIEYPNGNAEWKDRDALMQRVYIRIDDPAISAAQWDEYNF